MKMNHLLVVLENLILILTILNIILKIILPKNIKGIFLSIENDSAFYDEKEIVIKPGVKLTKKFTIKLTLIIR